MCLLAVFYQVDPECPVFVGANREEAYARKSLSPEVRTLGDVHWLGGVDALAGGTWLGVNEHGLVVAVTNRRKSQIPANCRSRGLLCRDLLAFASASDALASAQRSIASDPYDGFNLALIDSLQAFVLEAGDGPRLTALPRGIHLIANGELNDPLDPRLGRVRGFCETLRDAPWTFWASEFRMLLGEHGTEVAPPVCLHRGNGGTVSATVLALPTDAHRAESWYAPGPPCTTPFEDLSPQLRGMLAANSANPQEL
jgi:hypothetical protein